MAMVELLLSHLAKSVRKFCMLKYVKNFVCKWYPSSEVPAALLLHMTRYSIFSNSSIILLDYRLLLELHALTLAARSYVFLLCTMVILICFDLYFILPV